MDHLKSTLLNMKIISGALFNLNYSVAFYLWDCVFSRPLSLMKFFSRMSTNNIFFSKILQVLPPMYAHKSNFHNKVPFFSYEINLDAIHRLESNYDIQIDHIPIFSGTTSVIFIGKLNDHPTQAKDIIVKVKKKGLSVNLKFSYSMVFMVSYIVDIFKLLPSVDLSDIVCKLYENIEHQNDFLNEVDNLEYFRSRFSSDPRFVIPKVYRHFTETCSDIIVMDHIDCEDVTFIKETDREQCCALISDFNLQCILRFSMFHSDMHCGNIKVRYEGGQMQLVVLDFGIIGYLSPSEAQGVQELVRAGSNKSIHGVAMCVATWLVQKIEKLDNANIFSEECIESEVEFCDDIVSYVKTLDLNCLTMSDYVRLSQVLTKHGYELRTCFSRLYLSLVITHTFCKETLQARNIDAISTHTLTRLMIQNSIAKLVTFASHHKEQTR